MPVTMAGSIAVLLNVFFRDLPTTWWGAGTGFTEACTQLINVNVNVYNGSISILALCFAFALGYHLCKSYDVSPISGSSATSPPPGGAPATASPRPAPSSSTST